MNLVTMDRFTKRVNRNDMGAFTRQFATMTYVGIPMVESLDILSAEADKRVFKKIISDVMADVEAGSTLAEALKKHSCFSDLYINMVHAGEAAGILDVILNRLAIYLEKSDALIEKVKGVTIYPAVAFTVCIGASIFMFLLINLAFVQMFNAFGAEIPLPTKIVMGLGNFLRMNWWLVVAMIAGIFIGIRHYCKTRVGRCQIDRFKLKMPMLGSVIRKAAAARFTRTLGTLVSSGIPIANGLEIAARSSGNKVVEEAVLRTQMKINEGNAIADSLKEYGIFPPMVAQMIGAGEQTGALDEMLGELADFYDGEVNEAVNKIRLITDRIITLIVGAIVAGVLIAMYLLMFKLISFVSGA
jgi:type IV pilus assembly protein PilC